ncbi:lipid-A-disaccharide synthase [Roseivirga pacifica]|uniref:lipid-A-disaccharide synthase n=1 Tax=Roseivirga pacifica TaxID=1267423 RepID=UPI00209499DC|nr:lipid-A-disaccharide synthase [Roseivirga pacifica]MCO6360381.1 lipid-A-disaccharide synthase [Roseivirga pacifica]MCO6368270.1 lipid-A-disaccharide synthase [Roseivirga pacifica]MCO6372412.1 lipid-A-disaccharide synthase [Roseivirga pacifica]MCO6376470.1 lipid-A-disaccharide synthase [Roseivirga pacifica]MCO6378250.1 lipid-A-disaccharide synthase [Roseivirga pacifica]
MKYYIIAGEASGDMHAANMMKQIKQRDPEAYFRVWGGDKMAEQAQELAKHIRETSFMGIFGVLWNLRTIKRNFRFCEEDIEQFKPDVLILIDNSGFNLRIAKYVKLSQLDTRVYYYILPQAWAWKRKRVHTIHQWTDRIFAILPFEKAFYKSYGYDVDFVGHPIMDALAQEKKQLADKEAFRLKYEFSEKPVIALLPGSRKREIQTKLPKMLQVVKHFPNHQFVVAGSRTVDESLYAQFLPSEVKLIFGEHYNILNMADAALVTSGTATLETALFNVPQVVCYKPGWLTYHLMKRIISIKYISMVNLILDKETVKELIESDLNESKMVGELELLFDETHRERMLEDYKLLAEELGGTGASERVATLMIEDIQNHSQRN